MYSQWQRFVATFLLFCMLLQSCGGNFHITKEHQRETANKIDRHRAIKVKAYEPPDDYIMQDAPPALEESPEDRASKPQTKPTYKRPARQSSQRRSSHPSQRQKKHTPRPLALTKNKSKGRQPQKPAAKPRPITRQRSTTTGSGQGKAAQQRTVSPPCEQGAAAQALFPDSESEAGPKTLSVTSSDRQQVTFKHVQGAWKAEVKPLLPVGFSCPPQVMPVVGDVEALAALPPVLHACRVHVVPATSWRPALVRIASQGMLPGGGEVWSEIKKPARLVWGVVTSPFSAITYFCRKPIPGLPCSVTKLPDYCYDADELPDSQVNKEAYAAGEWVSFYASGGYWYARTSKGRIPVKSERSASLSLEDLVNSQFRFHKGRCDRSFGDFMKFNFVDYSTGLFYELELVTSPEQVQSNKNARLQQRREDKRREKERQRKEAERRAKEKARKKAQASTALTQEVTQQVLNQLDESLEQAAESLEQEQADQKRSIVQSLAEKLSKRRVAGLAHEVIADGYLSDDELDYDLANNTGSGFDFSAASYEPNPHKALGQGKGAWPGAPSSFNNGYPQREEVGEEERKRGENPLLAAARDYHKILHHYKKAKQQHPGHYLTPQQVAILQPFCNTLPQEADIRHKIIALLEQGSAPGHQNDPTSRNGQRATHQRGKDLAARHSVDVERKISQAAQQESKRQVAAQPKPDAATEQGATFTHAPSATHYGFKVKKIRGDGNCFFRSVADQLLARYAALKSSFSEDELYKVLRRIAANHVISNKELYRNFTIEQTPEGVAALMRAMDKDRVWAGHEAMAVLSRALQLTIVVIQEKPRKLFIHKSPHDNGTVYLHYTNPNTPIAHYESLYKEGDTSAIEAAVSAQEVDTGLTPQAIPDLQALINDTARSMAAETSGTTPKGKKSLCSAEADSKQGAQEEEKQQALTSILQRQPPQAQLHDLLRKVNGTLEPAFFSPLASRAYQVEACSRKEQTLQKDAQLLLKKASSYLHQWQQIQPASYPAPDTQALGHTLHQTVLQLSEHLEAWEQSLEAWQQVLDAWAVSLHAIAFRGYNLDLSNYHQALRHYQSAAAVFESMQKQAQGLLQAAVAHLNNPHYLKTVTTPALRQQTIQLAQATVAKTGHTAVAAEEHMQQARQATQAAQAALDKAQDKRQRAHKQLVRKQVTVMAHELGHQPLLAYLAGQGRQYISEPDEQGKTALHHAVARNLPEVAQWLLDHGADVNDEDAYGDTPLHIAAERGHLAVVRWLCEQGANLHAQNNEYYCVSPLHIAAEAGHITVVKWLYEHGADIKAQHEWGDTLLHWAAHAEQPAVAQWLLDHGADVNAKDEDGITPLHEAVEYGHLATVKWLCEHGAGVNAKDEDGITPLHNAVEYGHLAVVKCLCEHGAEIKAQDMGGLLSRAASGGHLAIVKYLYEQGANIKTQNSCGETPLHKAASGGQLAVVQWLYEHGADINARDKYGNTLLHEAARLGHLPVVRWLYEQGADMNARDKNGRTPLHTAASEGCLSVVQYFIAKGVNVNIGTRTGWPYSYHPFLSRYGVTAQDLAARNEHQDVVAALQAGQEAAKQAVKKWESQAAQEAQKKSAQAQVAKKQETPALARAKKVLQAAQAIHQRTQQAAEQAEKALQAAQATEARAQQHAQEALASLQTTQQHATQLTAATAPSTRSIAPYLVPLFKRVEAYWDALAQTPEDPTLPQQGDDLLQALYHWRQQEQNSYRKAERLFLCDDSMGEQGQAHLLGHTLPQHQYHIDELTTCLTKLIEQGQIAQKASQEPLQKVQADEKVAAAQTPPRQHHTNHPRQLSNKKKSKRIAQTLQKLARKLPAASQPTFKKDMAPLLRKELLKSSSALRKKILQYLSRQQGVHPQVLEAYPIQEWVAQFLLRDLAQGTPLPHAAHARFAPLSQALQKRHATKTLEQILWALNKKKAVHDLSLEEICDVITMLPADGKRALALLKRPADQWRPALRAVWLAAQLPSQVACLTPAAQPYLAQALAHQAWSLAPIQALLKKLSHTPNTEVLKRFLAFAAQHPIADDKLLQILATPDQSLAQCHHALASDLLQKRLAKLLPADTQPVVYDMIQETWQYTPCYEVVNTFLEQLWLQQQAKAQHDLLQPEHLRPVLKLLRDYRLDEATYAPVLQQLVSLRPYQWPQHLHQQSLQHSFGQEAHIRTVREIIEYMAKKAPDVAYLQDQEAVEKAYHNIFVAYKQPSALLPKVQKPITDWDKATLKQWAQAVRERAKDPAKGGLPTQAELIAGVQRAVELSHKFLPRDTQLLSLLVLLNTAPGKGRLAQINTGEGKSLIVAMFVATKGLKDIRSDTVTSSTELSIPEVAKQRPFFAMLGLTVAENSAYDTQDPKGKKKEAYEKDEVYGTASDYQGDILWREFFGQEIREKRPFEEVEVVVDEVDNLCFDKRSHSIRLSSQMPATNHLELLQATVWQQVKRIASHFITDKGQVYYILPEFHKDKAGKITILSGDERDLTKCMIPVQCLNPEGDVEAFIQAQTASYLAKLTRAPRDQFPKEYVDTNKMEAEERAKVQALLEKLPKEKAAYEQNLKLEKEMAALSTALAATKDADEHKDTADELKELEEEHQQLPWNVYKQYYPPIVPVPAHLKDFVQEQIPRWIQSAINAALVYKRGYHYQVKGGKIVPVDYNNTGVWQQNMVWSNGLAQFLQIKEGLKVLPENISTNFISTVGFFKRYRDQLYGLTGTLGNDATRNFFKQVYGTDLVIVPPYKQRLIHGNEGSPYNCKEITPLLIKDKDLGKWYDAIEASALEHAQQQRAVLIICKYIRQVHTLETRLKARYPKDKIITYTGKRRLEKDIVYPGEIIIATNIAGRGTDLTPSEMVEHNGGLHVCITFLPESYRVELQNAGRTARKGGKGTAQLILHTPTATSIEALRTERDKKEAQALQQAIDEVERMTFKDELFQRFCKVENTLLPTTEAFERIEQSQQLEEAWKEYVATLKDTEALRKCFDKTVNSLVQKELDAIPSHRWSELSHAEKQARKDSIRKNILAQTSFEDWQEAYFPKKRKGFLQELQAERDEPLDKAVVEAFEQAREYIPQNGALAVKHGWGPFERKALEERFGLWFHAHMPQGDESINYERISKEFDGFLHRVQQDADKDNLIHNAYFLVQKGNDQLHRQECYCDAIKSYKRAIALDPTFSLHARYNKAMALLSYENNTSEQADAKEELQKAKILLGQYKQRLLTFQMIVGQVQTPKPHTTQHLQHHLDILFQQEKHIDAAISVIEEAQEAGNNVEITKRTEIDAFFDAEAAKEHREQALAEVRENGLSYLFTIQEKKPKPWLSICAVALIGLSQIAAATLATVVTAGIMTKVLLQEGISDLVTAITSSFTGEFSWKEWGISKVISVSAAIISACIVDGWDKVKESAQDLWGKIKQGYDDICAGSKDAIDTLKNKAKYVALEVGKGIGTQCSTMLLNQGVGEVMGEFIERKVTEGASEQIMQAILEDELIKKAMRQDIEQGNDYWAQILIKEGLAMINQKNSTWYTLLKGISEGTAIQTLFKYAEKQSKAGKSTQAILLELGGQAAGVVLPMASGYLFEIRNFTETFLKDFKARIEKKYGDQINQTVQKKARQGDYKETKKEETQAQSQGQNLMQIIDAQERPDDEELQLIDRHDGQEYTTQTKQAPAVQIDPKAGQEERSKAMAAALTQQVKAQLVGKFNQHCINPITRTAASAFVNYVTSGISKNIQDEYEELVAKRKKEAAAAALAAVEDSQEGEQNNTGQEEPDNETDKDPGEAQEDGKPEGAQNEDGADADKATEAPDKTNKNKAKKGKKIKTGPTGRGAEGSEPKATQPSDNATTQAPTEGKEVPRFEEWSKENPLPDIKLSTEEAFELNQIADALNKNNHELAAAIQKDLGDQLNSLNSVKTPEEAAAAQQQAATALGILERERSKLEAKVDPPGLSHTGGFSALRDHALSPSIITKVKLSQIEKDIARLNQGIQDVSSKFGLAPPTSTFTGHFSKENILQMTRYAVSIGVPFGELVNVVTGLAPPPQTPGEWLSLATNVTIDAVGGKVVKAGLKLGGKALGLLKKLYTQCGGDKAVNCAVAAGVGFVAKIGGKGSLNTFKALLEPGGKLIGKQLGNNPAIRTVSKTEAENIISHLIASGAERVTKEGYKGVWYKLPGGGEFGVRRMQQSAKSAVYGTMNTIDLRVPGFVIDKLKF